MMLATIDNKTEKRWKKSGQIVDTFMGDGGG